MSKSIHSHSLTRGVCLALACGLLACPAHGSEAEAVRFGAKIYASYGALLNAPPSEGGAQMRPPEFAAADGETKHRDFMITKRVVDRFGPTAGCPQCDRLASGRGTRGAHTIGCRQRIEQELGEC